MKLDEALREASAAADRSTERALPGEPPSIADRGPFLWAAAVVLVVAGLGTVLLRNDGATVATDAVAETDSPTTPANAEEDADAAIDAVSHFVSDAPPEGLSLEYAGSAVDMGPVTGTELRWIYGLPDREPNDDEGAITIMALSGAQRPPGLLDGETVDINGAQGAILPDGTVMFELGDAVLTVHGGGESADLVAIARSVGVSTSGEPVPPDATPDGYSLLGSFDGAYYGEYGPALAADATISSYRQGYVRYLDLVSTPRTAELEHMYRWLTPAGAESLSVDGRTFTFLYSHDDFGTPASYVLWFDEAAIGTAISYGIERDDVDRALGALRADWESPVRNDRVASDAPAEETSTTVPSDRVEQAIPTVVLDGMEIVTAVDHAALGAPDWSADRYLYGPEGVDLPGPDDPILTLTVVPGSEGLLIGEPIEIGGHDGVIIDKALAGTKADIELRVGETTVQLTGVANVELDQVIAAAEQYATWVLGTGGFNIGSQDQIGVDLSLRSIETIGFWQSDDVNGALDANTVVYAEPGTTSETGGRRLSISSNSMASRSVGWLSWLYPGNTTIIDLGETEGVLAKPVEGIDVLRFEHADRVIEIIGAGMTEAEILAAAEAFSASTSGG